MTASTPTRRATTTANAEEAVSRQPLSRDLWAFLRQCAAITVIAATAGLFAIWFTLLPTHVQAMIVYGAIVTGCGLLIVANLRRRRSGR